MSSPDKLTPWVLALIVFVLWAMLSHWLEALP